MIKPYQSLADASRRLRLGLPSPELATPEVPAERLSVPVSWTVPVATQDPRDRHTLKVGALRKTFDEILVWSRPSDLDRLLATLQLYRRRIEQRGGQR